MKNEVKISEDQDEKMPLLKYPGQTIVEAIANNMRLTCMFSGTIMLMVIYLLFVPWREMPQGVFLLKSNPILFWWLALTFIFLAIVPGRTISEQLKRTRLELWTQPGYIDKSISYAVEDAIRPIYGQWTIVLIAAILIHHYWVPTIEGAIVTSIWLKFFIACLLLAVFLTVVRMRLIYESQMWR